MADVMGRLLAICGTPATGKSSYGAWLQANREWLFINHDYRRGPEDRQPLEDEWWRGIDCRSLRGFVAAVAFGEQDVVVEFGFPIGLLPLVQELAAGGVELWWFAGDRFAARHAFLERNARWAKTGEHRPIDIAAFDNTVGFQRRYWAQIRVLFRHRVLEALPPARPRPSLELIHEQIFTAAGWQV